MGGKKARKNFYQNHTYIANKKRWKKIVSKKLEKMYFNKYMNIETINGGRGKSDKKFLPETHLYREQKTMEKNRLEKVRKHVFFINTRIS